MEASSSKRKLDTSWPVWVRLVIVIAFIGVFFGATKEGFRELLFELVLMVAVCFVPAIDLMLDLPGARRRALVLDCTLGVFLLGFSNAGISAWSGLPGGIYGNALIFLVGTMSAIEMVFLSCRLEYKGFGIACIWISGMISLVLGLILGAPF